MAETEIYGFRQLQEILQSKCFERATTLKALLLYLWENKDKDISEYAIAVEALHRSDDFESKIDATVRVQIWRLRRFLEKYYESEGSHTTIRIVVPLGTHQVQLIEFHPKDEVQLELAETADPEPTVEACEVPLSPEPLFAMPTHDPRSRFLAPVLLGVIALLGLYIGRSLLFSAHGTPKAFAARSEVPIFWKRFVDNGKATRIILPTPLFFAFSPPGSDNFIITRDIKVNDYEKSKESPEIADLEKKLGKPEKWQSYTAASDTFGTLKLARYLDRYGIEASISSSNDSPGGIVENENLVVFGTDTALGAFQPDLDRLSFKFGRGERYIIDKRGPVGNQNFVEVEESSSRTVVPGLIALLPRGHSDNRLLIVEGTQTSALISYLTSDAGMLEIAKAAEKEHSSYFEAVVLSEVTPTATIQSRLVALRPFHDETLTARK